MGPDPQEERRQHPRIEKHFIVTYFEAGNPAARHNVSQLKNISRGGICFSSCIFYPTGKNLQILIKTPYMADTLNVQGSVVHCTERIPEVIYEMHVRLGDLTPEAEIILQKVEKSFLETRRHQ